MRLDETAIADALADVPGWSRSGNAIARAYVFPTFPEAIAFVERVADAAETANHHPDIDIRYRTVRLMLSTHDAGGLTRLDFDLARTCDRLGNAAP